MSTRGWCGTHYRRWLRHGDPLKLGDNRRPHGWQRGASWPPDDELVARFRELGTRRALAEDLGCAAATLTRYLKLHPELAQRLIGATPPKQTASETSRRYRERHPERMRKRRQDHYARNREQLLAANRIWHQNNRHVVRERKRQEALANPERVRARQRAWVDRNREKVRLRVQLQYHQRKGGQLAGEYGTILLGDPCSYCGAPAEHLDHIDPLSREGSPDWDNLTASCVSCNTSKQARSLLGFLLDQQAERRR
jgi:hypothetical protein